jgi:hypothetical protein
MVGVDMTSNKVVVTANNKEVVTASNKEVATVSNREVVMANSNAVVMDKNNKAGATETNRVDMDNSMGADMNSSKVDMDRATTATAPVEEAAAVGTALKIVLTKAMEVVEVTSSKRVEDQVKDLVAALTPNKPQTTLSNMAAETATCFRPPCPSWAARASITSQTQMSRS